MISKEEIPKHWDILSMGEVCEITYGDGLPKRDRNEGEIPVYGSGGVSGYHDEALYEGPAVILGRKGTIDEVRWEKGPFWAIDTTFYTQIDEDKISPKYLYYFFSSLTLSQYDTSSAVPSLRKGDLKKIETPVPPLEEQEKIAGKLDEIFDNIEEIQEAQEQAKELENRFLQSIIYSLIEERARDENWNWEQLDKAVSYRSNNMEPQDYPQKEFNYISLKHIGSGTGGFTEVEKTEGKEIKSTKREFSEDHILYGKLRPYLNKVVSPDFKGICSTDIIVFEPKEDFDREYIQLCMLSSRIRDKAENMMTGANLPRIKKSDLLKFKIPAPSKGKQEEVVEKYHRLKEKFESIKSSEKERNNLTEDLPKSVLADAFRGNLVN